MGGVQGENLFARENTDKDLLPSDLRQRLEGGHKKRLTQVIPATGDNTSY